MPRYGFIFVGWPPKAAIESENRNCAHGPSMEQVKQIRGLLAGKRGIGKILRQYAALTL